MSALAMHCQKTRIYGLSRKAYCLKALLRVLLENVFTVILPCFERKYHETILTCALAVGTPEQGCRQ